MPIHKVPGGYKWGKHGHTYKTREGAEKQQAAIFANGYREEADGEALQPGGEPTKNNRKPTKK